MSGRMAVLRARLEWGLFALLLPFVGVLLGSARTLHAAAQPYAWGWNPYGQLGDGTTTDSHTPVQMTGLSGAVVVAAGSCHSLSLKNDGTIWGWGDNAYGQLGDGTTSHRSMPVQVTGLSGVTTIAGGYWHSLAIKNTGSVWVWGSNDHGQVGDGTTTNSSVPIQVTGLSGVTSIAGGYNHSLAALTGGTVWAWGYNGYGELGNGTTTDSSTPVSVTGLGSVTAIAAGCYHSLALKSDGTVWTWGYNSDGQLGNGTTTNSSAPVQVTGLSNVIAIAGEGLSSLALKSDGTIWAWGSNDHGQLGDGTYTNHTIPIQVTGLGGVVAIAAIDSHSLAIKNDGTIWAWGWNYFGQLGDGTTTDRPTPFQVAGLSGVTSIAAGTAHSLALEGGISNTAPMADGQTVSTHWGTVKAITLTGSDADNDPIMFLLVAGPQHGTLSGIMPHLTYIPTGTYVGGDSFTFKVNDGAADSNVATATVNVTNTAPVADGQTVSTHWGTAKAITLTGSDGDNDTISFSVVADPQHGALSGAIPNLTYTPTGAFVGTDAFTLTVNDGVVDSDTATVTINVTNAAPTVTFSASPTSVEPNAPVTFATQGRDPDGDALTYLWEFGDGTESSEANLAHAYAAVGTYTAKVTVTDGVGATASAMVTINVSRAPTAQVATSDVVAFSGAPFTFDASMSTDPEHAIASFVWDFGDGTPPSTGQVISKVYDHAGTYTVTLVITDAAGVSTTAQRVVEVLDANQLGLFNGFMAYRAYWNRNAKNKDTFTLRAKVNVGDELVGKGTPVAVEIAGQRFTGVLDSLLLGRTNRDAQWQLKANIRKQPSGTVMLKLRAKHANLGLGFNQQGAVAGADRHDPVDVDIPVTVEVGGRVFELNIPSEFRFNGDGRKARGSGGS